MGLLHYNEAGSGAPLVLLHSGGMAGKEWQPQMPVLGKRFRTIAPDLPGHGDSPMVADTLTIGDMGRSVIELLDELGIEQAHLVGSSMGGAVSLWLTVKYPKRVKKLTLYRANYHKTKATYTQTKMMANPDYWRDARLENWMSGLHAGQGGPDAWKQVIERVSQAMNPENSERSHTVETLRNITQPTLIVCGDRDPLVPMEDLMTMYNSIPDSALWVMPHASHVTASNTWRADSFANELTRFLARKAEQAPL